MGNVNAVCINRVFTYRTIGSMSDIHPSMERLLQSAQIATAKSPRPITDYAGIGAALGASAAVITNWKARGVSKQGAINASHKWHCTVAWILEGKGSPETIVIDGQHRLYGQLKNLDLNKVMIESLNLDAFVAAERTIEDRPTEEEVDLIKAFRKLPKDDRADLVRDLRKRAEAIDEMVRRYLLEHPPASGTPATRTTPSGAGERRHQTAAPGDRREKYIARTSRRSSNRGAK